jgi:hypothetical protein
MNSTERKFAAEVLPRAGASTGRAHLRVHPLVWLGLLLALASGQLLAQSDSQQTGTGSLSSHPLRYETGDMVTNMSDGLRGQVIDQKRLHQMNVAKYKTIVSNADKLVKLVAELNADIGDTRPASLTPEQLRKVAMIEKLARSVKDDMRTPIESAPSPITPAQPMSNSTYAR